MSTLKSFDSDSTSSDNRICEGTKIIGTIESAGDIAIDGVVEGTINAKGKIIVENDGKVKGDLHCDSVDISGQTTGKIIAQGILTLKDNSNVNGEIIVQKLIVEDGAIFNGTCKMQNGSIDADDYKTEYKPTGDSSDATLL